MGDVVKSPLAISVALLIILLGLYVGAYLAMVESYQISLIGPYGPFPASPVYCLRGEPLTDNYKGYAETIFMPIHKLDRELRPETWPGVYAPWW